MKLKKGIKVNKFNFKRRLSFSNNTVVLLFVCLYFGSFLPKSIGQTAGNQPNTSITGVFRGALDPTIKLEVNRRFIDNSVKKLETTMEGDSFRFDFYLDMAQTVTIKYLRNQANVYVEPGQTLHIDADANSFYFSFEFKGKLAGANNFLREFAQKHKNHYPKRYQMFSYKKGIVWYKVHRDMDTHMRGKEPEAFTEFMTQDRDEKLNMLDSYELQNNTTLTEAFKQYMWAEISYFWAYNMLVYGYAFGFSHNMDFQDFFGFMYEIPIQNDRALGSKYYRDFLEGAVNYYCEGPKKLPSPDDKIEEQLIKQFEYGAKELTGKPKAYFLTEIIRRGFKENVIQKMQTVYDEFLKENPYKEFNRKVQ